MRPPPVFARRAVSTALAASLQLLLLPHVPVSLPRATPVAARLGSAPAVFFGAAPAAAAVNTGGEPSAEAVLVAKRAFKAFDARELSLADELFSQTIAEWRRLGRGVEELTSLLVRPCKGMWSPYS